MHSALPANGLDLDSVGYVILHQASRYIVDTVAARLGASDQTRFTAAMAEVAIARQMFQEILRLIAELRPQHHQR